MWYIYISDEGREASEGAKIIRNSLYVFRVGDRKQC